MADEKTAEELAAEHTKAELEAAAAVEGVEVKSKDTKAEIAEKLASQGPPAATHAHPGNQGTFVVGNQQRRSDDDAILNSFVDVVSGEHQGRYGVFFDVAESESNGFPKVALVRSRDAENEVLSVPYESLRPSERRGR